MFANANLHAVEGPSDDRSTNTASGNFHCAHRKNPKPETRSLFHRHRLSQIPGLIHVTPATHRNVVSQKLQRNDFQNRR